jgi:Ala-tRNA(Pro) deacylase
LDGDAQQPEGKQDQPHQGIEQQSQEGQGPAQDKKDQPQQKFHRPETSLYIITQGSPKKFTRIKEPVLKLDSFFFNGLYYGPIMEERERSVLQTLDRLGIPFRRYEHPPVFTVEQAEVHWQALAGAHCKNLFVRNQKGNRYYLIILEASKKADLANLARKLGEDRFSFASAERLGRYLGLEPGAVSPFGLINDLKKDVKVILDQDLKKAGFIHFHPNVNTVTVGLSYADFEKFLAWCGNEVRLIGL